MTKMTKMVHCSCKRAFLFTFLFLLEIADLGLDWNFYYEITHFNPNISSKQPNITFIGPNITCTTLNRTELKNISHAVLSFAIFGTITFLCGCASLYWDARKDYRYLTFSTLMSCISTWGEDFAQIVLAVMIAIMT